MEREAPVLESLVDNNALVGEVRHVHISDQDNNHQDKIDYFWAEEEGDEWEEEEEAEEEEGGGEYMYETEICNGDV